MKTAEQEMKDKHTVHIAMHEKEYGARLGELKNPPSKKDLDEAYKQFIREKAKPVATKQRKPRKGRA